MASQNSDFSIVKRYTNCIRCTIGARMTVPRAIMHVLELSDVISRLCMIQFRYGCWMGMTVVQAFLVLSHVQLDGRDL